MKKTTIIELTPIELDDIIRAHVVEKHGIDKTDKARFEFEGWSMEQGERVKVETDSLACKITFTQAETPNRKSAKRASKKW